MSPIAAAARPTAIDIAISTTTTTAAPLRVLFATPECAPWVKTGGLGDVSAALPKALAALGHDVRVLMPAYGSLRNACLASAESAQNSESAESAESTITLPAQGVWPAARLRRAARDGFELWLLDCPALYDRDGGPYLDDAGRDHADNALRFGFLSHVAALLSSRASPWRDWPADVLHANDWPTGLAPAYLALMNAGSGARGACSVFTLHNLAFQGLFAASLAPTLAIPDRWLAVEGDGLLHWGQISTLKAGVRHATALTTVSPTYAREIQSAPLGFGMEGMLRLRGGQLHGILNGIDTALWNPRLDPLIARRFDADTLDLKVENKAALQRRFGLPVDANAMLLGLVGRLTEQKGIDLVLDVLPRIVAHRLQLVMLGRGDPALEARARDAGAAHPEHVGVELGFDEALAHLIEAGADAFLMPSRFEPCGLNQLYSLAYGTPPIVHGTGGLADSVRDAQTDGAGTGFVMPEPSAHALWHAIDRAHRVYRAPATWRVLQRRGMAQPVDWTHSAMRYVDVYRDSWDRLAVGA